MVCIWLWLYRQTVWKETLCVIASFRKFSSRKSLCLWRATSMNLHEPSWQDCCVEFPALNLFGEKYSNEIFKHLKLAVIHLQISCAWYFIKAFLRIVSTVRNFLTSCDIFIGWESWTKLTDWLVVLWDIKTVRSLEPIVRFRCRMVAF